MTVCVLGLSLDLGPKSSQVNDSESWPCWLVNTFLDEMLGHEPDVLCLSSQVLMEQDENLIAFGCAIQLFF